EVASQVRPRPDEHTQQLVAGAGANRRLPRDDAVAAELLLHRLTRRLGAGSALDPDRQAPTVDAVGERLGKRADDGGHALGGPPVVAVPPDDVAAVELRGGRALGRLDAV